MVTSALRIAALAALLATSAVLGQNMLECYTCTMSGGTDDSCFTNPENSGPTPISRCSHGPRQCCLTSRTDSRENPGIPQSMFRGCLANCSAHLIGTMVTKPTYSSTTYETFCDEDRCNNGAGNIQPVAESDSGSENDGKMTVQNGAAELKAARFALGLLGISLMWNML